MACLVNKSLIDFSSIRTKRLSHKKVKYRISVRRSPVYNAWRIKVLVRDKYKCQKCGRVKCRLQVHHIRGFTKYPHLRLDVNNAITLCQHCHNKFHDKYGKQNFPDSNTVDF